MFLLSIIMQYFIRKREDGKSEDHKSIFYLGKHVSYFNLLF